jgi:hypothetical protein
VTTDHRDGRGQAAEGKDSAAAWPGQAAMASVPAPPLPAGLPAQLANRALVYLRPDKIAAVWPHLDQGRSGMILAGDGMAKAVRVLQGGGAAFPIMTDQEGYRHYTATRAAPFRLPDADSVAAGQFKAALARSTSTARSSTIIRSPVQTGASVRAYSTRRSARSGLEVTTMPQSAIFRTGG